MSGETGADLGRTSDQNVQSVDAVDQLLPSSAI